MGKKCPKLLKFQGMFFASPANLRFAYSDLQTVVYLEHYMPFANFLGIMNFLPVFSKYVL